MYWVSIELNHALGGNMIDLYLNFISDVWREIVFFSFIFHDLLIGMGGGVTAGR